MCQDFELFLTVRALATFGGGLKDCNEANKLEAQKRGIKEIQKTNKKKLTIMVLLTKITEN